MELEVFAEYLASIDNPQHRAQTEEALAWVHKTFPNLVPKIAWNQPMFADHGTFIIGFSVSKDHLAVSPERAGMIHFADAIVQAGHSHSKQLVRFPWNRAVDFSLLGKMIAFNISDKADCTTFWRK